MKHLKQMDLVGEGSCGLFIIIVVVIVLFYVPDFPVCLWETFGIFSIYKTFYVTPLCKKKKKKKRHTMKFALVIQGTIFHNFGRTLHPAQKCSDNFLAYLLNNIN